MRIVVRGVPAPQGSKRHVGNGIMVESSRAVGPWREAVRAETQRAMDLNRRSPSTGPMDVRLHFVLPRPKSLPRKTTYPAKRPDLDKLVRAVLDGLTAGGAWLDDAQVVSLYALKRYTSEDTLAGCTILVDSLEES